MQTGEIIIIAILALIVLGPTRLPELARRVGKWTGELRQAAREITAGLEAEVADIKGVGDDLRSPARRDQEALHRGPRRAGGRWPRVSVEGPEAGVGPDPRGRHA